MVRRSAHGVCRKKPIGRLDSQPAQFRAQRQEMIVLHPEHRVRFVEAQQRARHEGVDFAIGRIIFGRDLDQIGARMQRRPQRRIGKALVIAAIMLRRHIDCRQRAGAQRFDLGERIFRCAASPIWPLEPTQIAPDSLTIGISAAANPPAIGSSAFARATRLETTMTFTGIPPVPCGCTNPNGRAWFLYDAAQHVKGMRCE